MTKQNTYDIVTGPTSGELFTAETFLAYLRLSNDNWWPPSHSRSEYSWVFRGHEDVEWELVPSIARAGTANGFSSFLENNKVTLHAITNYANKSQKQLRAAYLVGAFNQALKEFKHLSEELRLSPELENTQNYQIGDFVANGGNSHMPVYGPETLAQHHGIPTFLLDWSKRPETAAHFSSVVPRDGKQKDIAVFALLRTSIPIILPNTPYPIYSFIDGNKFSNAFLYSQQGIFTKHTEADAFMARGEIEPLEKVIIDCNPTIEFTLLKKIVLAGDKVPRLRELLFRENITNAHVMPTLDNVARVVLSRLKAN